MKRKKKKPEMPAGRTSRVVCFIWTQIEKRLAVRGKGEMKS